MLRNNLKIAWRTIRCQPVYTLINVAGMAIGMACCLLIALFVLEKLSYDDYHREADRIYRVVTDVSVAGAARSLALAPSGIARTAATELPEVEAAVRIGDMGFVQGETRITVDDKSYQETGVFIADSTFFAVFSVDFVRGNPQTALAAPGAVVITEETAQRLFGDSDPIGQTAELALQGRLRVTAVVKAAPHQSHFHFNYLISAAGLQGIAREVLDSWGGLGTYTYLLLKPNASIAALVDKLNGVLPEQMPARGDMRFSLALQKLTEIHLHSQREFEISANADAGRLYIFSAIAFFVLLIACINFASLATAQSRQRTKEIGLRKVFGAQRSELIGRFLSEAVLLSLLAFAVALLLVELILPFFNRFMDTQIKVLDQLLTIPAGFAIGLVTLGCAVFAGLVAGSYPAFWLAALKPIRAVAGRTIHGQESTNLRRLFVTVQFAISIFMIIGVLTVIHQLQFMKTQHLGFAVEQIVVLPLQKHVPMQRYQTITDEMQRIAGVRAATITSSVPGRSGVIRRYQAESQTSAESQVFNTILADFNFVRTYDIELIDGRDLSARMATDSSAGFLINEAAARKLGWPLQSTVGRQFSLASDMGGAGGQVVGLMRDFHHASLQHAVEPLVVKFDADAGFSGGYLSLRLEARDIAATLNKVETAWRELEPEQDFAYFFLREDFARQYRAEERLSTLATVCAGLAIFVACLGLLAFAAFTAEQRTKEIGIRKVLGATVASITALLSLEFVKLVILGNLIAWPFAWFAVGQWLQNFAHRNPALVGANGWWLFAVAGGLVLTIALATVSTHAVRTALANPVQALRYE